MFVLCFNYVALQTLGIINEACDAYVIDVFFFCK